MVARKRLEVDLRDGTGRVVKFDVPVNATPTQIGVLAQRAIKQNFPGEQFQRPRLDRPVAQQAKAFDASVSATPNSLRNRAGNAARTAAGRVGFSAERANQIAARTEGVVDFVPGVGDAIGADDAKRAFDRGNYGEAAIGALATGVGLIPVAGDAAAAATKAMFLGARAQIADKGALAAAKSMERKGASRDDIWKETGWGKGADGQWRFETDDSALAVNPRAIIDPDLVASRVANNFARENGFDSFVHIPLDNPLRAEAKALRASVKESAEGQGVRAANVISGHPLAEAYPYGYSKIQVGAETTPGLNGSWDEANSTLRVRPPGQVGLGIAGTSADPTSTIAHELQHFVQGQEGFARGGMTGTVNSMANEQIQTINELMREIVKKGEGIPEGPERDALFTQYYDLMDQRAKLVPQAQIDPFEGYKRLAGEVEARNVQKRLDWSPEMRRAVPPWKTQEYADEDQFKIWRGDPAAVVDPRLVPFKGMTRDQFDRDYEVHFDMRSLAKGEPSPVDSIYEKGLTGWTAPDSRLDPRLPPNAPANGYAAWQGLLKPGATAYIVPRKDAPKSLAKGVTPAGHVVLSRENQSVYEALQEALEQGDNGVSASIRAYHGSPHDFDEFSLDNIGGGEGSRAYGDGLYFSESEDVAKFYRPPAAYNKQTGEYDQPGALYEVEIDAEPEEFLDWDAPLGARSDLGAVQVADRWRPTLAGIPLDNSLWGSEQFAIEYASNQLGRKAVGASTGFAVADPERLEMLKGSGIPGIAYRDAGGTGSRYRDVRNFVVFDPARIKTLKKNGEPVVAEATPDPLAANWSTEDLLKPPR